ncbi:MAG: hypothetical protein WCT32_00025 [Patescibacteria group bacterium]|jgi:hypothetical protein
MNTTFTTSLLTIIGSLAGVVIGIRLTLGANKELSRSGLSNQEIISFFKKFYELENYIDELLIKYGTNSQEIFNKIDKREKLQINVLISDINSVLITLYVFMNDRHYRAINDSWSTGDMNLITKREEAAIILRRCQFPKTKYLTADKIKLIERIKYE